MVGMRGVVMGTRSASSTWSKQARGTAARWLRLTARELRYLAGRLEGAAYRTRAGEHPAHDVPDQTIAERVRAMMGSDLKRRALDDVHIDVRRHIAYLRGHVPTPDDAHEVEARCLHVPGVDGVQSYLEVGPPPGTGGPDIVRLPSDQLVHILALARRDGCRPGTELAGVRAVLATFAERVPEGELRHLWAHLPADLRGLLHPPVRLGGAPQRIRHAADLHATIACAAGIDLPAAERLTTTLLHELRSLAPEENADVDAVLPRELKELWSAAG